MLSVFEKGRKRTNACVCACVLARHGVTDGHIPHIRPEARNSSRPWGEPVLFITEWENKPSLHSAPPATLSSASPEQQESCPLQQHTVVSNSLNWQCLSPTQRWPDWSHFKNLRVRQVSLCDLNYLMWLAEEALDVVFCCSSHDRRNTGELSGSVHSKYPLKTQKIHILTIRWILEIFVKKIKKLKTQS